MGKLGYLLQNNSNDGKTTEVNISTNRKIQVRAKHGIAGVQTDDVAFTTSSTTFVDTGLTKCTEARARVKVARKWLDKILENYNNSDEWVEHFTEAFLVSTRSVTDYVVRDFLESLEPKLNLTKISEINYNKTKEKYIKKILTDYEKKESVINFLKKHKMELDILLENHLVRYFFTLRNLIVHAGFPHIYENTYEGSGKKQKISQRRLQTEFVNYLLLEDGDFLLTNSGDRIVLEGDNSNIRDFDYIAKLSSEEKQNLENLLKETEAKDLLQKFFESIENFVELFEKPI